MMYSDGDTSVNNIYVKKYIHSPNMMTLACKKKPKIIFQYSVSFSPAEYEY